MSDIVEQAVRLKQEMEDMKAKKRRIADETEVLEERLCRASSELAAAAELKEKLEEMEAKRSRLVEESASLEAEHEVARARLAKAQEDTDRLQRALPDVEGDEVLKLDIGGSVFKAYRSTLMQFPNTVLATMVSSRWANGVRQEDGSLFFDMDPKAFEEILEYLRARRIQGSASPFFGRAAHDLATYLGILEPLRFHFLAPAGLPNKANRVALSEGGTMCEIQNTTATRSGGSSPILVVAVATLPITRAGTDRAVFKWSFEYLSGWGDNNTSLILGLVDASCTSTSGGTGNLGRSIIGIEACSGSLWCLAERYDDRLPSLSHGDTVTFCVDMRLGTIGAAVNNGRELQLVGDPEIIWRREWNPAVYTRQRPASGTARVRLCPS